MNIDNRWLLFIVGASAAAGAAIAANSRHRRGRRLRHHAQKEQVKSWENEGGNLAPMPAPSLLP
jgi:hypothetical protein